MIEMNTPLPLDRNSATTAMPVDALRSPAENPANASPRQAEVPPGVEVQISSAAREVAARDPLPAATSATTPSSSAGAPVGNAGEPTAAPETTTQASTDQSANAQNRAMQMFTETAGIGVEQANPSPLRDIA